MWKQRVICFAPILLMLLATPSLAKPPTGCEQPCIPWMGIDNITISAPEYLCINQDGTFSVSARDGDLCGEPAICYDGVHATWDFGTDYIASGTHSKANNECSHYDNIFAVTCRWTKTGEKTVKVTLDDDVKYADDPSVDRQVTVVVVEPDIDTDSNNDGSIDETDEPIEEDSPGRIVGLNDDDDGASGENDLAQVDISYTPAKAGCKIRLEASSGGSRIKVWTTSTKGTEISLPKTWVIGTDQIPSTVWVEGISTGEVMLDLVYLTPNDVEICRDKVKLTVVSIKLKEVSFSGTKYFTVRKDDDSGDYFSGTEGEHWQDNSSPLDGDAEDPGDHKYPVCFTRNTKMKATVKFIIDPTSVLGTPVKIKGDGPGNLDFPETTATVTGNEVKVTNVECTNPFPNEVTWYRELAIDWYVSCKNGTGWMPPGTSKNEFFIVLGDPACATRFRTMLYLACKNDGTDADSCLSGTWSSFSGPANVCAWSDADKDYKRPLHYYEGDFVVTTQTEAKELLHDANGQCHAWAEMLKECLLVNNVPNVQRTEVLPYSGYDGFAVKNIAFDDADPAFPPSDAPWIYDDSDLDDYPPPDEAKGIAGQNMETPHEKKFARHYIVCRGSTYYDPSYGTTCTSEASFTNNLDAWENYPAWRRTSTAPSVTVQFITGSW